MSQQRIYEIEEHINKLQIYTPQLSDYIQDFVSGRAENLVPISEFVGTQDQINAEFSRRKNAAEQQCNIDYNEFQDTQINPLLKEIDDLTMALIPERLKPAAGIIYSMAYERGHSAGYGEVYGILSSMVQDIENIVNLCCNK